MKPGGNIAFIGGRGAGKSKISRKFGKLSGRPVFSTDMLISYEAGGHSITAIVAKSGWLAFRDQEYDVLKKVSAMRDVVIDCGGGILIEAPGDESIKKEILSSRKLELLQTRTEIIYIQRSMDWLLEQAPRDANRPELIGDYRLLLENRLPMYEKTADFILNMEGKTLADAFDILLDRYGEI